MGSSKLATRMVAEPESSLVMYSSPPGRQESGVALERFRGIVMVSQFGTENLPPWKSSQRPA